MFSYETLNYLSVTVNGFLINSYEIETNTLFQYTIPIIYAYIKSFYTAGDMNAGTGKIRKL